MAQMPNQEGQYQWPDSWPMAEGAHKQALQKGPVTCCFTLAHICISFDVSFFSLVFFCSTVQIECTLHSHTNQLWQTLAVFIYMVHNVYNLQLTYITEEKLDQSLARR